MDNFDLTLLSAKKSKLKKYRPVLLDRFNVVAFLATEDGQNYIADSKISPDKHKHFNVLMSAIV